MPTQYTPSQMRLFNVLCKKYRCKTEVPFLREGVFNKEGKPKSYQVDILVENKIAVEVDGPGHDFEGDKERDAFLERHGLSVLHLTNGAVKDYLDLCIKLVDIAVLLNRAHVQLKMVVET